jgi:hypothetical protein
MVIIINYNSRSPDLKQAQTGGISGISQPMARWRIGLMNYHKLAQAGGEVRVNALEL